jgi:hypothetical protein
VAPLGDGGQFAPNIDMGGFFHDPHLAVRKTQGEPPAVIGDKLDIETAKNTAHGVGLGPNLAGAHHLSRFHEIPSKS